MSHLSSRRICPSRCGVRRDKRARMLAEGVAPYPVAFDRTDSLADIRNRYADLPTDTASGDKVAVTGRVIFIRNSGKLCFATLARRRRHRMQAMMSLDGSAKALEDWKRLVDLGDHVGMVGEVIT